jgi:hypothetical protein
MKFLATLLAGVALLAATQTTAHAFPGFYAGKSEARLLNASSQVVLVRDGKRTVLTLQSDYQGPLEDFVLVVPTPTPLKEGQVRFADSALFERLDAYSSPRLLAYRDADPCDMHLEWGLDSYAVSPDAAGAAVFSLYTGNSRKDLGVEVLSSFRLGVYNIVNLVATQSAGLEAWLRANGYRVPPGTSAALQPYIRQGMGFFVVKASLQALEGSGYTRLRPLQFAYESDKLVLPLRLGMLNAPPDQMQDLVIYAITRTDRMQSSNYRTLKPPSNTHLPYFVKPQFRRFFQDMVEQQRRQEPVPAVVTEYVWDMAWCDPCTAEPLSKTELQQAGVFWGSGQDAAGATQRRPAKPSSALEDDDKWDGWARLTRLHVRYNAKSFAEDLVLTQAKDNDNWQARYLVQQPFDSGVAACKAQMAQFDCQNECRRRVDSLSEGLRTRPDSGPGNTWGAPQQADCMAACVASKKMGVREATRYYQQDLPLRLQAEKKSLANLTGWSMGRIEALPGADKTWGRAK